MSDNGLSAHGSEDGEVPESSEDSTRAPTNVPSGERVGELEPSAGTKNPESSRTSSEVERDAKSSQDQVSEKSDAEVLLRAGLSEDSQDKDKDAPLSEEDKTDGLDALGARTLEVPDSSESTTRVTSDAMSGEPEEELELSAGQSELRSSEDS